MSEATHFNSARRGTPPEVARKRIEAFTKRFGQAHLHFAQHAAFPLVLTSDLAYRLWANFQQNVQGEMLGIPWIAVADLLLSSLCDEVGHELYEMDRVVRETLLGNLQAHPNFGSQRLYELSHFLLKYIERHLKSDDPDISDLARAQQWTALAYIQPDDAAHRLAQALCTSVERQDISKQLYLASLIETFTQPLADAGFTPLLTYARGLERHARGDMDGARTYMSQIATTETSAEIQGMHLPIFPEILAPLRKAQETVVSLGKTNVLIATLGNLPIVVTSMYSLLTEQGKQPIDHVIVLHTQGDIREMGYLMIDEALHNKCIVESHELYFEDIFTEETWFAFFRGLFALIHKHQNDAVYLSLTGGPQSMAVGLGLATSFYSHCVKGLYDFVDKSGYIDGKIFKSIGELEDLYTKDKARFLKVMFPALSDLQLISVPFTNALHVSEAYVQKLLTMTTEQLQDLWENDPNEADQQQFLLSMVKPSITEPLLQVYLTEQAKEEFESLGANAVRNFTSCFKNMRFPGLLVQKLIQLPNVKRRNPYPCYFYKRGNTAERLFFHTEPGDIAHYPQNRVERVIVEHLVRLSNNGYNPNIEQLVNTKYNAEETLYPLEEVLRSPQARIFAEPSVLIVPMGTHPMVATQLYTLLSIRENRNIREVLLLYPEGEEVRRAVQTAKNAFDYERIKCTLKLIRGLADITSKADCELYQAALEQTITGLQATILQQHPDWRIDLALSGTRKAMAAMTLFAAQRTQLRGIYHTVITNETLARQIEAATYSELFHSKRQKDQNDILFLRAYKEHEGDFQLFEVPIGPLHGN